MPKVAVLGASGFAGALAAQLLWRHPEFDLVSVTSRSDAGKRVDELYPRYRVPLELVEERVGGPDDDGGEQGLLGRVAPVEGAPADPRLTCDVVDVGPAGAVPPEHQLPRSPGGSAHACPHRPGTRCVGT